MAARGPQPDAPRPPKTPMELLTLREGEGYTRFDRYALPVIAGILGFCSPIVANRLRNRPGWAGIWQHICISAAFYCSADFYIQHRMKSKAEDFAVLKHYISLHPEDFPPYEPAKIKYLYFPWTPVR